MNGRVSYQVFVEELSKIEEANMNRLKKSCLIQLPAKDESVRRILSQDR